MCTSAFDKTLRFSPSWLGVKAIGGEKAANMAADPLGWKGTQVRADAQALAANNAAREKQRNAWNAGGQQYKTLLGS